MELQEDGLKDEMSDYHHVILNSMLCVEFGLNLMPSMEGSIDSSPTLKCDT